MSEHSETHDAHEGPIKTPRQLVLSVLAAFIVPVVAIILLTQFVSKADKRAAGSDALAAEAVALRLQPVGSVLIKSASDPSALKTGEQVYQAQCSACHNTGAAGAPKAGDKSAWSARVAQGLPALLNAALKGKGAMGAQGGGDHSDFEIARAVVYLANQGGGRFDEPRAPAPKAP